MVLSVFNGVEFGRLDQQGEVSKEKRHPKTFAEVVCGVGNVRMGKPK